MRLFEKKEPQLLVRVAIVDGKYKFKFTIADSNIREVFDMFERVIAANEVPEKGTLTMVSMREIKGHENGKFKSIKTNHIYAIVLNNLIKNEIKYNSGIKV